MTATKTQKADDLSKWIDRHNISSKKASNENLVMLDKSKSYACPACGKRLGQSGLGMHLKLMHGATKPEREAIYRQIQALETRNGHNNHIASHNGSERKFGKRHRYPCPECGQTFRHNGLGIHFSTKHGATTKEERAALYDRALGKAADVADGNIVIERNGNETTNANDSAEREQVFYALGHTEAWLQELTQRTGIPWATLASGLADCLRYKARRSLLGANN